jgi:hypothetical protein
VTDQSVGDMSCEDWLQTIAVALTNRERTFQQAQESTITWAELVRAADTAGVPRKTLATCSKTNVRMIDLVCAGAVFRPPS